MQRERYAPKPYFPQAGLPFATAEEAWFWFVQCFQARRAGARIGAGRGETVRPCDPDDVLAAVNRLYRRRCLRREHLLVLSEYGERLLPPDGNRKGEAAAARLWEEALDRLACVLRSKGIVQ
ncbi:MAG: hypothetical protein J4G10_05345 [Alphaproteobacteria bacterium]|nr:hypothetical protein [Alphaproteobacteria bacterium]